MATGPVSLPNSLNLPPHLSAHKYFMVCTLTVAAWDALVLSPRSWRLLRSPGWPLFKIIYHFLRFFMPAEFIVVGVAFYSTAWSDSMCRKTYLFEPICTAILLAATSLVHVIRIQAIYDRNKSILALMTLLFAVQVVVTAVSCGFYRAVPLLDGQGCISGPKYDWVGIYWIAPTLLYTVSFALALARSIESLQIRKVSYWKLMLRDGLNLYGSVWLVNMVNVLFWFLIKTTGPEDPIQTVVGSMAAVLTTAMTLRIILSVRGPLDYGGAFALSVGSTAASSRNTNALSGARSTNLPTNLSASHHHPHHTFTLDDLRSKPEAEWTAANADAKIGISPDDETLGKQEAYVEPNGIKIAINQEVDYDGSPYAK